MPLQRCNKTGWRWGKHGKCYKGKGARVKAIKQMKAILSTGWTEHRHHPESRHCTTTCTLNKKPVINNSKKAADNKPAVRINPLRIDPTRTATLQRRFMASLHRKLSEIKKELRRLIVEEDAFGLANNQISQTINQITNSRWKFLSDPDKLLQFQLHLSTLFTEKLSDKAYARYVEEGFRKGRDRAFSDLKRLRAREIIISRKEFMERAFQRPQSINAVKVLAARVFTDLQGMSDALATQLSRVLLDSFIQGNGPLEIARNINKEIDAIDIKRARTIARTEIIRAHAEGQLDSFEELGLDEVGIMVEWATSSYNVCPMCASLEGVVLSIEEAHGMIPRHANCQCCFIPANVGESKKGQVRSSVSIREAIQRSVAKESPNKKTTKERERASRWTGTDKSISKKRPTSLID